MDGRDTRTRLHTDQTRDDDERETTGGNAEREPNGIETNKQNIPYQREAR